MLAVSLTFTVASIVYTDETVINSWYFDQIKPTH